MTKLSTQEERIMLVLWKLGNCTVAQIIDLYNDPKPSQNTIATFMGILEKKNYVRHRRIGRSYEYSAIVSKFDYSQFLLGQILLNYFDSDKSKMKIGVDFLDL